MRLHFTMRCLGSRSASNRVVRNRAANGGSLWPATNEGRHFGVEIECVGIHVGQARDAIRAVGIDVESEGYNHRRVRHWKVTTDASVSGQGGACEIVSPVLNGANGHEQISKVCAALTAAGATINRTCGLHVHVDARGLGRVALANMARYYYHFETAIDGIMPRSRRGNNNTYCVSLSGYSFGTDYENDEAVLRRANGSRFMKLNLQSHSRHGTVEFRHHAGTVEAHKISHWVRLCIGMVDRATATEWNAGQLNGCGLANLLNDVTSDDATYSYFMVRQASFATTETTAIEGGLRVSA
jgi:hypothetical protein